MSNKLRHQFFKHKTVCKNHRGLAVQFKNCTSSQNVSNMPKNSSFKNSQVNLHNK